MFRGKLNRGNYFFGFLLNFSIFFLLLYLSDLLFEKLEIISIALRLLAAVLFLLLTISLYVRRLHDLGHGGLGVLLLLLPFVNCIMLLAFLFVSGQEGTNKFGLKPEPTFASVKTLLGFSKN